MKNMKKTFLLVIILICSLLVCACQNTLLTKIYIDAQAEMIVGEKQVLTITNNLGTTNYDQYAFLSSNENIVFIDENGCLTAKAKGETMITVLANGVSATIQIKVKDQPIAYIKNRQVFHKEEYQTFLFSFTDKDGNYLRSSGTAEIRIINSNKVTVYNDVLNFSESDFLNWTTTSYGNSYSYLGCGIKIYDSQISKGKSCIGTMYVVIKAVNANFKEATFEVTNLPVNASVSLSQVNGDFVDYNSNNTKVYSRTKVKNATIDFEFTSTNKMYVTIDVNCVCTYLSSGWKWSSIGYKVYDENNNLVKTGEIQMGNVSVNQSWTDSESFYLDIGNYTITFCNP